MAANSLGALLMRATAIINRYDTTGNAEYQELSDIIHDISVSAEYDNLVNAGGHEVDVLNRLQEIRRQLARAHHAAAAQGAAGAGAGAANLYAHRANVGRKTLPKESMNSISMNTIESNNAMVNFQGESGYGRYYKKTTFNSLPTNAQGRKRNPITRASILPGNVTTYRANIANQGGKRKTRKTRKSRKARKTQSRK